MTHKLLLPITQHLRRRHRVTMSRPRQLHTPRPRTLVNRTNTLSTPPNRATITPRTRRTCNRWGRVCMGEGTCWVQTGSITSRLIRTEHTLQLQPRLELTGATIHLEESLLTVMPAPLHIRLLPNTRYMYI